MKLDENNNHHSHLRLTLLVATRNRADRLRPFLTNLSSLDCSQPWELIIVDNGSTDETRRILNDFTPHLTNPTRTQIVYEPRAGVSRARNTGIAHAGGDIIAFTDDDCYPDASYLNDILHQFDVHQITYLGGRVTLYDTDDLRITTKEDPRPLAIPPYSFLETGLIHGANMAVNRYALLDLGGFDERFGPGAALKSAEDIELLARLSWCGYHGRYDPIPTVAHHHRIQDGATQKKLYKQYDHGRGAYYLLYSLNKPSRSIYISATFTYLCASLKNDKALGRIARETKGAFHLITRHGLARPQAFNASMHC